MSETSKVSRRQLLKIGGTSSVLGFLSLQQQLVDAQITAPGKPSPRQKSCRIVIIGAGISGLAAAHLLRQQGHEPIVLEARDRIGGRIFTDRNSLGFPIDLGASWIHGISGNPLYELANGNGIKTIDCQYDSFPQIFNSSGKTLDPASVASIKKIFQELKHKLEDLKVDPSLKNSSLAEVIAKVLPSLQLRPAEAAVLKHVICTDVENDYATNVDRMSFSAFDEDECFTGGDYLVPEGYSSIVNILSKDINVKLGEIVKTIDYSNKRIEVGTTSGSQFTADFVVVTLPLGVLKKKTVEFIPRLPKAKLNAIEKLDMGVFDKVYLRFPEQFWSSQYSWIEYAGSQPDQWPMFFNLAKFYKEPILVAFNVGRFAQKLEALQDSAIVEQCMQVLRKMYGAEIPTPIATKSTSWGSDPYAFGSYSFVPVNASANLYDDLGGQVRGRLFFAGEACSSDHYSSADAAYISGVKAAKQILALVKTRTNSSVPADLDNRLKL